MSSPGIAIITRTKNRALLLERTIKSVLAQTHEDWAHVIVNDGGDPAPVEALVARHEGAYAGRLRVIHNPVSVGMEAACNIGIRASESRYLTILDEADSWSPYFLETLITELERRQNRLRSVRGIICHSMIVREMVEDGGILFGSMTPFNDWMQSFFVDLDRLAQASRSTERQLVDIGYEAFGPAMAGWFMWLQRRIAEIAPKKVLLFARDARLVNRLVAEGALSFGAAEVEYIYVSRYALSFAAIRVLDDRLLESLMRRFEGQTIGRFLGAWCEFSPERLKAMGFPNDPDAMISWSIYPELKRFIYENQAHFLSAAREHRDRAGLYLARMVKDESTALIDVGWNGNMQSDWHNAVITCISRDHVHGLYFALLPSAQAMIKRGHKMEGWYWQPHRVEEEHVMLSSGGVELLELALSADHGTTLGYDADGSPILADAGEDPDYQEACRNLQAGITAFWNDLRALCPERELALQPGRPEEWTAPLSRLVMNPSSQESELLGDIRHSVEGGQVKAVPLAPKLVGGQAKPERVLWRPGFAARNGLFSAL